jgi:hypothetical protein
MTRVCGGMKLDSIGGWDQTNHMDSLDDLECDLEILRDVVFRMEHEVKSLGDELNRVKKQLDEATRAMKRVKLEAAQQTRH